MALIGTITLTNTYSTIPAPNSENVYADVYITLIDTASGQRVNGNNVIVTYQINDNGMYSTQQVTISGQSQLIYSGIISQSVPDGDGSQQVSYYKTFSVTNVSGTVNPAPPVNSCDLVINYINIDKPESAPGANDAQITVNASSSYLPIMFSLDNVAFQTSGTFAGLAGGLKTVYVTDANSKGCAVNQQVTIPVSTSLLINDPSVTIGSSTSRWSAAFNPIVFTYQRKDFEVTTVTADSLTANAALTINANLTGVLPGDSVYVNAGTYNGVFNVISATANSLTINTPYTATASGFININRLRPYYRLLTQITYHDKILGRQNTITSTNRPDSTGLIKADLSNFLQSLLRAKDESDFTQVNFRDDNLSASYQVAYTQQWDDGSPNGYTSGWIAMPDPYYVIYAAKQLGDKYGGNLAAYVPFKHLTGGAQPAKWVTDFAEPAYSISYPFDLSFIYGEDLAGLNLYATITLLDINKNPAGSLAPLNLINEDGFFLLNQDSSKLVIEHSALANTPVIEHIGLNRFLIDNTFDDGIYYFLIGISYTDTGAPSTFNYSVTESAAPFVDANLQIKDNGAIKADAYTTGSGTFNMAAGDAFSIEAYSQATPIGTNPKLTLTVSKNGTIVFDQTTAANPGASLVYTGTVDVGAVYAISAISSNGTADVTPVNITDNTTVTSTPIQVVQNQLVRIDKSPDQNSVYLRWIGLTGSKHSHA